MGDFLSLLITLGEFLTYIRRKWVCFNVFYLKRETILFEVFLFVKYLEYYSRVIINAKYKVWGIK